MPDIKRVARTDYYLEMTFDDDSVRAIDIANFLSVNVPKATKGEPVLTKISIRPDLKSIIWDDGTEITADFLYNNSQLIGWLDNAWGNNTQAWQSIKFETALIKIDFSNNEVCSSLLLDGKPFPALRFSSVLFGIYENTPWYHVPFPGDNGVYEPEWEEPQIVFDTLDQLVHMANNAIEAKLNVTINITEHLQKTGYDLYVASMSPRSAGICAKRFRKNAA
jgi:hypothetical protein